MLRIKTILHPTDFSEPAMEALRLAHSLARDHGAKLVLLAVAPPIVPTSEVYVDIEQMEDLIEQERQHVAALSQTITDVPVEYQARGGAPGQVIVLAAQQLQAELIVMGTHGRGGMSRILMGSVAEHVLRHADCPVLTVKLRESARLPKDDATTEAMTENTARFDAAIL